MVDTTSEVLLASEEPFVFRRSVRAPATDLGSRHRIVAAD